MKENIDDMRWLVESPNLNVMENLLTIIGDNIKEQRQKSVSVLAERKRIKTDLCKELIIPSVLK